MIQHFDTSRGYIEVAWLTKDDKGNSKVLLAVSGIFDTVFIGNCVSVDFSRPAKACLY